jgi:hypothetical protein
LDDFARICLIIFLLKIGDAVYILYWPIS